MSTKITNTATVSSTTYDPNLENNVSTIDVDFEALADVAISKLASHSTVYHGETLNYTLLITNHGPSTAENVVVNDTLPAGLINPTFTVEGEPKGPWTGSFTIGKMDENDIVTIIIIATVADNASFGTLSNTATVTSDTIDPDLTNNTSTANVVVGESADVSIVKTASHTDVIPGDTLSYTLVITNAGPDTAHAVLVEDDLPAGLLNPTFTVNGTSHGAWTGSYSIGNMTKGTVVTIIITGTVGSESVFF